MAPGWIWSPVGSGRKVAYDTEASAHKTWTPHIDVSVPIRAVEIARGETCVAGILDDGR